MKRFLLVVACLVCALAMASPASAVVLGADQLVGTKADASPANIASELGYANTLITAYNLGGPAPAGYALDPPLPTTPLPAATGGVKTEDVLPANTTGSSYIWLKLGPSGALYYIAGLDTVTGFSNPFGSQGFGFSHATLFGPTQVPEGATLMLLGFGLAGVGTFRRFLKR